MQRLFSLVILVVLFLSITTHACVVTTKFTVTIDNQIPGDTISAHCKSKDNDLGDRTVPSNSNFQWKFCQNFSKTTLYFCHFYWGSKQQLFDVFNEMLGYQCFSETAAECRWVIKPDGFYLYDFDSKSLIKKHDWPHYNVVMESIEVDGDVLDLPTDIFEAGDNRGTIIDSGTTLAYLQAEVVRSLIQKIMARQPDFKTYTLEDQFSCFPYKGNVDDGFPVVTFHFGNSVSTSVYPHDYLFAVDEEQCVGWMNSGLQTKDGKELTLLGDIALSNKIVVYDLENQTIGWTDYNCSSSIKVKDEQSGNIFAVGAHNLSAASFSMQSIGKMLTLLLVMAIFCTLL